MKLRGNKESKIGDVKDLKKVVLLKYSISLKDENL